MIVIGGDAGRQKTVFFSLTLLTLQAQNSRDVLIGKLSKFDRKVCTTSFFRGYVHIYTLESIYVLALYRRYS